MGRPHARLNLNCPSKRQNLPVSERPDQVAASLRDAPRKPISVESLGHLLGAVKSHQPQATFRQIDDHR